MLNWSKLSVPSITKDVLDKSKRAADTLVNAYLSIYFAYTPFYGSLTLYEWVPLSKSVQLHSLHCTEAKLYKRTKSRPSPPDQDFFWSWKTSFESFKDYIKKLNYIRYFSQNKIKSFLSVGELNPGLPRDRRGYLPLY